MFVKPAPGRMVRWPRTMTPLREAGETVPENTYWLRALRDEDVEIAEPPAELEQAEPTPVAAPPPPADGQTASLLVDASGVPIPRSTPAAEPAATPAQPEEPQP